MQAIGTGVYMRCQISWRVGDGVRNHGRPVWSIIVSFTEATVLVQYHDSCPNVLGVSKRQLRAGSVSTI
jgi:hypothetical protein